MSERDLKPCPFCGGRAQFGVEMLTGRGWVECSDCGNTATIRLPNGRKRDLFKTAEEAASVWNTRRIEELTHA